MRYFIFFKLKEMLVLKREKECVLEELAKAQETIAKLSLEKKSAKSIDLYDPNSPDVLNKKISNQLNKSKKQQQQKNESFVFNLV